MGPDLSAITLHTVAKPTVHQRCQEARACAGLRIAHGAPHVA